MTPNVQKPRLERHRTCSLVTGNHTGTLLHPHAVSVTVWYLRIFLDISL